jgi:hypothetical protein
MNEPHDCRVSHRLSLLDGMVLVAAIALGQAAWVALCRGSFYRGGTGYLTPSGLTGWVTFLSISALALSSAVVGLNIRGHRWNRRRLATRPGFVACIAIVVASLAEWLMALRGLTFNNNMAFWPTVFWSYLHSSHPPQLAPALVACWLLLWMGRRCRLQSDWVDLVGCLLGLFVIVSAIVVTLAP